MEAKSIKVWLSMEVETEEVESMEVVPMGVASIETALSINVVSSTM